MSGEGVSESVIRLPYLDELQRIMVFRRLSEDLFVLWFGGEFQDVGDTQSCSRIIPPRSLCSRAQILPTESRRHHNDFRTKYYFRMCKEFYAPYFILFISNYLYLSLIISNYTSATALLYLCDRNR